MELFLFFLVYIIEVMKMRNFLGFGLILILVLSLIGCGQSTEVNQELTNPLEVEDDIQGEVNEEVPNSIVAGKIEVKLIEKGFGIYNFILKNQTQNVVNLEFNTSQRYDFEIKNKSGEQVHLFSSTATFLQALGTEEMIQGEELSYEININNLGLENGEYTMEVWSVANTNEDYRTKVEFEIE